MRRAGTLLALLVVAGLLLVGLVPGRAPLRVEVPAPRRPPASILEWLSSDGQVIRDEQGRAILLRGFNAASLLAWPRQPLAALDGEDLDLMQRAGFDVVRLPIAWSRLEPERGRIDEHYLDEIDRTVRLANAHGLYVILDMHVTLAWSPRYGGAGAPDWAVVPLVPHVPLAAPGEWTEMLSPAVVAATDYFWLSTDWQTDLIAVWQAVAARFGERSGVVGYDLFNEPTAVIPPGYFERCLIWPLYARLISAISQVDANHLFFIEGPYIADFTPSIRGLTASSNVVYSPHLYTGSQVAPLFYDDPDATPRKIQQQQRDAAQVPAPAWWGELGIVTDKPYAVGWTDAALDAFDDLQVGWAWWQWRQDWNWGVRNGDGEYINYAFLRHLARPYVVAAPRGVRPGRGDATSAALTLAVAADHQDAVVVVAWPSLLAAEPEALGQCVAASSWEPTTARLYLSLQPGQACEVRLESSRADAEP